MFFLMKRAFLCNFEHVYPFAILGKFRSVSTVKGEGCILKQSIPVGTMENIFDQDSREFDEQSAVNHLRKSQLNNEENFMEKIKDWETSTQHK